MCWLSSLLLQGPSEHGVRIVQYNAFPAEVQSEEALTPKHFSDMSTQVLIDVVGPDRPSARTRTADDLNDVYVRAFVVRSAGTASVEQKGNSVVVRASAQEKLAHHRLFLEIGGASQRWGEGL